MNLKAGFLAVGTYLSTGEGRPLFQIFEHLQDLIASRRGELDIVMSQPKIKDPEIWWQHCGKGIVRKRIPEPVIDCYFFGFGILQ
jgi:hypothetical protein